MCSHRQEFMGSVMTPKKLRSLRELQRLRKLDDQVLPDKKFGGSSIDSIKNDGNYLWPVEKVLITSRITVDIQVLTEAGHLSGLFDPRPGFVAVVDQSGMISSVERLRISSRGARSAAAQISQTLSRSTSGTPILGLIDQPSATRPIDDLIEEVNRALHGTPLSGKFIVLCHSAVSLSVGTSASVRQIDVVRVKPNHVQWSSWNESHELAVITPGLSPISVEVV